MQATATRMHAEKRGAHLFITLSGILNCTSATELNDSIRRHYDGSGVCFLDLRHENAASRRLLADVLADRSLAPEKFFLIGLET
ncbi:MAG: hypothetical protein AB1413_02000 [Thermodesulfobacteriota bacterium]